MSETSYKPDRVSIPGETLQELLIMNNLSQADLAERMGRPKKTINEIIAGKTAITPETAIQLERVFKTSAQFWLNREARYRAWLAEQAEDNVLKTKLDDLKLFPIKELVSLGWISEQKDRLLLLKELLSFFGVASIDRIPQVTEVAFRRSEAYSTNPWALAAWLRKGELDAIPQTCKPFSKNELLRVLANARSLTNEKPEQFVPKLITMFNSAGICLVFTPCLQKTNVSGATRWVTHDKAVLQLSLRHRTNDHFWFSLFHESAHLLLGHAKREILLEVASEQTLDPREAEANKVASELLIPDEYAQMLHGDVTSTTIRKIARELDLAPGIVVGRYQFLTKQFNRFNDLKVSYDINDFCSVSLTQ
ncbi:MAG: HigA family addiction module antitoxin [Candidatus Obscuribacterales bacterium]